MSFMPIEEKKPFCQCYYELKNGLPKTQNCFVTCDDQWEVIENEEIGFPEKRAQVMNKLREMKEKNPDTEVQIGNLPINVPDLIFLLNRPSAIRKGYIENLAQQFSPE